MTKLLGITLLGYALGVAFLAAALTGPHPLSSRPPGPPPKPAPNPSWDYFPLCRPADVPREAGRCCRCGR